MPSPWYYIQVLTTLSIVVDTRVQSLCTLQGEIDVSNDWYGLDSKFVYTTGEQVDFNYDITYDFVDSDATPITLVLYKEQQSQVCM